MATKEKPADRVYALLVGEEGVRFCRDIPESQCHPQPGNFLRQVAAQSLSKTGDVLADPKVVLPWLLGAVGAPLFLVGFLVPIRESLALLPQVLVGSVIRRFARRKGFWVVSSLIEGICIIAMGALALGGLRGAAAGWAIVALLVLFSIARGVASIAAKDTLGKTVSKGKRGRVSGYAATVSGLIASLVGLYLVLGPEVGTSDSLLYAIVMAAGASWLLAALVFWTIAERPGATEGGRGLGDLIREQTHLLFKDAELRKFLLTRTLLLSTALLGPVYVSLAQQRVGDELDALGWLVLASGLAGFISASLWGALADRSSRLTMALAALLAALLGAGVLLSLYIDLAWSRSILFFAVVLFFLNVSHAGVRIGRKTQVVDMAGADRKAEYVALSNTVIGILLLILGAVNGLLLELGLEVALSVLSFLALLGGAAALTMKNVQA
ncbi:MAG: MFS transporter [Kiloniellales bacterium]